MAGRFSIEATFRARDRMSRSVARMSNRISKMARSASRSVRNMDRSFGKAHRTIAKTGAVVGAAALAATLALTTLGKSGADFEQAITNVGAVGLKTRAEIAPLEQMALKLGATTKFTATEAANAMEIMAKAGFSTTDILAGVPGVLNAAAASGLEIAEVSDHVSNALKGMGLASSEAGRVADVLALASSRTNSTIGTLGESIRNVASTARELGVPFEEAVASVALLQDVGLDASVAGSAMNTMLTKLAKPPAAIAKQMKRLGLSFKDAKGDMLPFDQVIGNIAKAADRAGGSFDKVAFLADLVGLRGQKAASNLATLFETGKLTKLTEELYDAGGAAKKMADLRMDTLQGDLTLLGSAVDGLVVSLFGLKGGALRDIVKATTAWVTANKDLIVSGVQGFLQDISDNLPAIVRGLKLIGGGLAVFYTWAAAVKVASIAMTVLEALVLANPLGLLLIALSAAGVAIYAFWDKIGPWAESAIDGVTSALSDGFEWLKSAAKATAEVVVGIFVLMFPGMTTHARLAWKGITIIWSAASKFFAGIWDKALVIAKGFARKLVTAFEPVTAFFEALWSSISDGFQSALSWIVDALGGLLGEARQIGHEALSGGPTNSEASSPSPQVLGPQERAAAMMSHSISETMTSERMSSEVTIRDESGRAEVTRQPRKGGMIRLEPSGAF